MGTPHVSPRDLQGPWDFSLSLLQSVEATRTVIWFELRLDESSPRRSITRHLLPLVWVDVSPFHISLCHVLESEPGLTDVPFSLTDLRIQQLSREPVISHPVYMTQPSEKDSVCVGSEPETCIALVFTFPDKGGPDNS